MDATRKRLAIAIAGAVVLAAAALGVFIVTGSSGGTGSDGVDSGSTLMLTIWIPIWVVIFLPLLARRGESEEQAAPIPTAWLLALAGGVGVLVLVVAHLLLR